MDDVTVDLGAIPLDHARTLLLCILRSLDDLSERESYMNAVSLKSMLAYRIAKAEKTATFVEPG